MKKKIIGLCAILLLASGCGKVPQLENGQEAVVSFKNGEMISVDDFYKEIKDGFGLQTLITMIDTYIYETEFSDWKDTAKDNTEATINAMIEQYGGENEFLQVLQQYGYQTIEAYKDYLYYSNLASHGIEEYAKKQITNKEIEEYYNNKAIGDMEISHILITSDAKSDATADEKKAAEDTAKATVNEIIEKLNTAKKNGEDVSTKFAELAKEYSKDTATKDKGGALGKINYGDLSTAYDELISAAAKLKDGEYSTSVITTELGYHVILKTKTYEKESLDTLRNEILTTLGKEYASNNQTTIGINSLQHYRKEYGMEIQDSELQKQYNAYLNNLKASVQSASEEN